MESCAGDRGLSDSFQNVSYISAILGLARRELADLLAVLRRQPRHGGPSQLRWLCDDSAMTAKKLQKIANLNFNQFWQFCSNVAPIGRSSRPPTARASSAAWTSAQLRTARTRPQGCLRDFISLLVVLICVLIRLSMFLRLSLVYFYIRTDLCRTV